MSVTTSSREIPQPASASAVPTILKLVCELTGMRLALVARLMDGKWTACGVHDCMDYGLAVDDRLEMGETILVRSGDSAFLPFAESVGAERFPRKHGTPPSAGPGRCIWLPISGCEGQLFGWLCVFDGRPNAFKPDMVGVLTLLGELLRQQLCTKCPRQELEEQLLAEREASRAREEFIAVLGHDLRNPLTSIIWAADLMRIQNDGPDRDELYQILRSCGLQIGNLIEDLLDFARGRLGKGIPLERRCQLDLTVLASEAISELCLSRPGRVIRLLHSDPVVACVDEVRFRQLLSNLLGNALQHSPPSEPVNIGLDYRGDMVRIAITNGGPPLSEENRASLFSPFALRSSHGSRPGLGLGLFIASEIARAHGGAIEVSAGDDGTTLTTLLPRESSE
ncbi:GAF domain-containing sensor histidine kinase [Pelagicoccus sp. NFK12]|uniref:histidine kinase n=1 Tax=Pelagicoccus enzymogenes TaxID=2773457 RepID=A0A927F694_9BACT|nr:GAF domain-containing sensor histidine kinase [Pelagicoccus enzymogenes]MBD5779222.1 GAF domain-containing sensor histidine kinase [Pelagicoccus enzymogenes]